MKRAALAALLGGAALLSLAWSSACAPEAPDASGGAAASGGAGEGGSTSSSSSGPGAGTTVFASASASSGSPPTYQRPDSVPEGWVSWAEWDWNCPMWFPPDEDHMPPPLEWEPCTFDAAEGLDCRQMKSSLASWGKTMGITLRPMLRVVDGTPLLYFGHIAKSEDHNAQAVEYLVVPPDGRPRFAMRQGPVPGCLVYPEDLNDGHFTLMVRGIGAGHPGTSKHDGLLLGTVGEIFPKPVFRNNDELVSTWFVGRKFAIRTIAPVHVHELYSLDPLDFEHPTMLWPQPDTPPVDRLPPGPLPRIVGEDVVFEIGSLYEQGIMTYHPDKGVRPLVRYPGDTTRAAGNVGTDGKHLVWSYRESEPDGKNPVLSVMAAPFTTEASKLAPKRLRSEPYLSLGMAYSVGCGYAGHQTTTDPLSTDISLLLVRIEDGRSWFLKSTDAVYWYHALGFTCDEVFAIATIRHGDTRLVRIRLDSLGPGLPPD